MGGLGKTTLAKMVCNDQEVQKHFQLKMWHCVSDNFDTVALLKSNIELVVNSDLPDTIELLQKQLQEVIGQKRFILILDDVWYEDKRMWEDVLKPLLCSVGGPGSVIVVTCRSKQVASIMCTVKPHELVFLSADNSWDLFSNKTFSNGVEEQAELVAIGRHIVNKCGGLPLALKTMGGLLSSQKHVHEWKSIEASNIGDNDRGKYEVMLILKLSCKHLSSEMKQCFALCAIFRKDYEMQKDFLIELWMANGFIQEEETMDLIQKGEFIFDELVWRSFLQDKKVLEYPRMVVCKMHDLMHDLAKYVSNECASIDELNQRKALLKDGCHMQMSKVDELEQISGLCKGRTCLRTLLAPSGSSHKDFKELLQISSSLRALHCPPYSIAICKAINAKHLRYLDLSVSDIVTLPNSICLLYNLQTLRLVACKELRKLPEDMTGLRKLINLYLFDCDSLRSMSPNFGVMNNLHILTTFVVDTGYGLGIEQLKDLKHLSNRLELLNLSKIKSAENAKEANLSQKQNLTELLFSWDQKFHDEPKDVEEVLQCLEPHYNIQNLEILGYGGPQISQLMRNPEMFNCLKELKMSNCARCKSIPVVWLSVSLEILSIEKMDNLTTLCNSLDVEGGGHVTPFQIFQRLKRMRLFELPSLEIWAENSVGEPCDSLLKFPMLEVLRIENCPKLASIPMIPVVRDMSIVGVHGTAVSFIFMCIRLGSWPFLVALTLESKEDMAMLLLDAQLIQSERPLEKLEYLALQGPNSLDTRFVLSRSCLMPWKCFRFVEMLVIRGCNNLVRWPSDELGCFDRLCVLRIEDCDNQEEDTSSSNGTLPLSLEELEISLCKHLVKLPSNLGNLANLISLYVGSCSALKALPDGMCGLTSLRELRICDCPALDEFPHGLVERLPALELLKIHGCPELVRLCRGGKYFNLVSSIPRKIIFD
ncbi:hypothetical protein CFC21_055588 [Triticum aestivum]|uniref:NB-ARC domain-containing protein n=2 Tax=Triticum aestivum TaxID=4565 RepID=A0A9R1GFC8_WHEAT|nr:disease resistance protein RGA2-like [Triticum aestivum]KAF7046563.1 hypothetical protein CFC21_055588 [Triticum aestivum]